MNGLTVGSLFSGIGGFDLGLERAGMHVVWQCEQDPYCRRVLARHWPGVPCHPDVRALVAHAEARRDIGQSELSGPSFQPVGGGESGLVPVPVPYVDVLAGGFPCQDLSVAGKGAGIDGARSGLWAEFARLIGELSPRYVIVENVSALLARGMGRVLGDLAALGYDAEWDCLPASAFGAPHRRDRVWLVAYPSRLPEGWAGAQSGAERQRAWTGGQPGDVADGAFNGCGSGRPGRSDPSRAREQQSALRHADGTSSNAHAASGGPRDSTGESGWWSVEPDVGRVAHGIPARVDRLRSLGNALVPQIAEWIGRRIVSYESEAA